jgi:hypothetical protein
MALASLINTVVRFLFGLVYEPLKWLGPFWSLVIISALAGILLVWIFGKVSNQKAIHKTRDRLSSELLGLRLFKDDLRVFFGIQGSVLVWTLKYLRYSLLPMLILMVPTLIILIQLNLHYGARPLRVGERALVKVKLRDASREVSLSAPENLKLETASVHVPEQNEICWRVRAVAPGRFDLIANDGKSSISKKVAIGGRTEGVSTARTGESFIEALLYPGEAAIPSDSAIRSIEIVYPELDLHFLGWHVNWLILFLALSLVLGYSFKGMLGVQI